MQKKYINILKINLATCFLDEPVAALSNDCPVGYMISTKMFEALIDLLEDKQGRMHTTARFRPTAERSSDIADSGLKLLQNASDKVLTEFTE